MSRADPTSPEYERAVAARWGPGDSTIRSFWQSPVVLAEINRRITGDAAVTPLQHFVRRYCVRPRARALSIGCGDAGFEREFVRSGACEKIVAVDLSAQRLERARAATPPELADRIELVCANVESWQPQGRFDLVIARDVVHHLERLEQFFDLLEHVLTPEGLLYLDEFVGPSRFQWTDKQLELINRLLERLPPELRRDLVAPERGIRSPVSRPAIAGLIAADPSEAARSAEIPELLRTRLIPIEERPWGGAIFHQLFNRIMGNFAGHDDVVRLIMELDAILTDEGVIGSDYLWGVYRLPPDRARPAHGLGHDRARPAHARTDLDGRLESVEGGTVVGWAADLTRPDRRVGIDLHIDHKLAAKTTADLVRTDLARNGIGDGAHAFRIELPSWVRDGRQHSISIVVPAHRLTLPTARLWGEHNRTTPEGTELVWARYDPAVPPLPSARVLEGRDGWAFPCDDAVGSIEQMLGRLVLSESDLCAWKALVDRRARELREQGVAYVVAIVPAKAGVHPERLSPSSPPLGPPKVGRALIDLLADTEAIVVDLLPALRDAARLGRQLFYKRDAGWNHEGASIGGAALLEAVRGAGVPVAAPGWDIRWLEERVEGDLAGKPAVALADGRLHTVSRTGGAESALCPDEGALGLARVAPAPHLTARDPGAEAVAAQGPPGAPSALVVHDPGGRRLLPFLSPAFASSSWIARDPRDAEPIPADRLAVVIEVLDEPLLVRVPYT